MGIGGAYMCIYGMEGPGGYQLFGRTIQMWNSWRRTASPSRPGPASQRSAPRRRVRRAAVRAPTTLGTGTGTGAGCGIGGSGRVGGDRR